MKSDYYNINQSPLYKLTTKKKLAQLLKIEPGSLFEFAKGENYKIWKTKKNREIQEPYGLLKRVHARIFSFLRRITPPPYLHSGVRNRTYITNAKKHLGLREVFKLDIHKFFPSVSELFINGFWQNTMQCPKDVAYLLQKICTFRVKNPPEGVQDLRKLPTGSCISQALAFYAYRQMFDDLYSFAQSHDVAMTVYVDDITFSAPKITKRFMYEVKKRIRARGLRLKKEKIRFFSATQNKVITGVVLVGDTIRLKKSHHLKIYEAMKMYLSLPNSPRKRKLEQQIKGRLCAAGMVEEKFKKKHADFCESVANEEQAAKKK